MPGPPSREWLRCLGSGASIDEVCRAAGMDRGAFNAWWRTECAARVPAADGERRTQVHGRVEILRDARGVPHIFAGSDEDLFFGYGYAMGQDRLFQMDLRRRRGQGRLAEVLGPEGVEADILARTIGLPLLAAAELDRQGTESLCLLEAFARGVNALIEATRDHLPIEFELLGYVPEPWTPFDSIACTASWRFQLTGRPWVISVPELARRTLPDADLYRAFIEFQREADEVTIVPSGAYPAEQVGLLMPDEPGGARAPHRRSGRTARAEGAQPGPRSSPEPGATTFASETVGAATGLVAGRAEPAGGSNNWVVSGARSASGRPIVASDPHMPYEASSSFFEVHLSGGSFEAAGTGFVGMPGLAFGRNRRLAWAITNNICSQRDLYHEDLERTIVTEREETIEVRDGDAVRLTVRSTRHGPLVDHLLPAAAAPSGPVAMRWVGALECDWFSAQLRLNRASTVGDANHALRGWLCPTFSLLLADDAGHIGYAATGTIPVRGRPWRGFRSGDDPADEWIGLIPRAGMPQVVDPARGWISTANNRPAPADFPYPLSGTWDENYRARRIGQLLETTGPHDRHTFGQIHADVRSERALAYHAALVTALEGRVAPEDRTGFDLLRAWDFQARADSAGAAIWEVVTARWAQAVAAERFPAESAEFVSGWMAGLAARMLVSDSVGWFRSDRLTRLAAVFHEAIAELRAALGPDPGAWRWGALHHLVHRHPLGGRGDLGELLNKPAREVGGDSWSVNNSGLAASRIDPGDPNYLRAWEATSGAGYRLIADLGDPSGSIWTITAEGQSAHPGSPHAADQLDDFVAARYHELPLDRGRAEAAATHRLVLEPDGSIRG
ncbi:MAG TPA: penicillin acylase family protein [Candidatus Saccharimonadales bacterium]|nr:penicillin acylase family protein [Candidatus Saccharimonadales bacterium]